MFEVRLQTYWSDVDAAGIVYFPHFFRFVGQAEEELFRASGKTLPSFMEELQVRMPRVEAFSTFSRPIRLGAAIRVQLNPEIQGEKTIRYNFEILDDKSCEKFAAGYVTVVCVDADFRPAPIPVVIRNIIRNAQSQ
jgi:4-hydroxybenzoyl-CoA thioesterase